MKINLLFLVMGLLFTITSKLLQYYNKVKLGNALVIPAAIFFILAIILSLPKVKQAIERIEGIQHVAVLSIWACIGVVSFQVMMMLVIGNGNKLAFFLLVPIILAIYMVIKKWQLL